MENIFGLKISVINQIKGVFLNYPQVQEVILYGSRAMGNYKNGSDIDLTVKGDELNLAILNKIDWELDDLLLPYTFDLSLYKHIDNSDLINHIKQVGKVFYARK